MKIGSCILFLKWPSYLISQYGSIKFSWQFIFMNYFFFTKVVKINHAKINRFAVLFITLIQDRAGPDLKIIWQLNIIKWIWPGHYWSSKITCVSSQDSYQLENMLSLCWVFYNQAIPKKLPHADGEDIYHTARVQTLTHVFAVWLSLCKICSALHHLVRAEPSPLAQSDAPSDWYSRGMGSILGSIHISSVEIWSWNNFYSHSLPTINSSRAVVNYWQKYLRGLLL